LNIFRLFGELKGIVSSFKHHSVIAVCCHSKVMRDCVLLYLNPGRSVIGIHQSLVEASQSDQISWSHSYQQVRTIYQHLWLWRDGHSVDPKCDLCGDLSPTVLHILNECTVALNQLRYTWRHDQQEDRLYIILFQTIGQTMSFQFTCIHDGTVLYSASLLPHPSIQWTLFSLWYI